MPRSKALMKKRAAGAHKKIVIKPFRKPPRLPDNYYEETSQQLLDGTMKVIFSPADASDLSLQTAYTQVVNLVSHQFGSRLYTDLVATLRRACEEYVLPSFPAETPNLLGHIHAQFQKYVDYLLLCRHVFLPLDRTHTWSSTGAVTRIEGSSSKAGPGAPPGGASAGAGADPSSPMPAGPSATAMHGAGIAMNLWQAGLEQFRLRLENFQLDDLIYQKWWESLKLDWENSLALDQQALLKSTWYMWQDLCVLGPILQNRLEPDLIQLFQQTSQRLKHGDDGKYNAMHVIDYCHGKWIHVAHKWSRYLPKAICITLLEINLIQPHLHDDWLLHANNFDPLLETENQQQLGLSSSAGLQAQAQMRMAGPSSMAGADPRKLTDRPTHIQHLWMLAARIVEGTKLFAAAVARYAKTRGLALTSSITDAKTGKARVEKLLDLQKHLQLVISSLPHAAEHISLKPVWEDVVNPPVNHPSSSGTVADTTIIAESLAKYVDMCLRDSKKQPSLGSDSNGWASRIISGVFCYLQAKDVFEAFYKRDLAKRLLWSRVVSVDVEKHFVSLLKAECGAGYTSKMEGMFQDTEWSRETKTRYKQALMAAQSGANPGGEDLDMDIQVLTTGYWPAYPQYKHLILPEELKRPQEHFIEHFKSQYQGRRITWQYALGHCVVQFQPKQPGPKFDLVVSLCQALVLIQFNGREELSIYQLMERVGLDDRAEMERLLQSLSIGKDGTRVLMKHDHDADKKKKIRTTVHNDDKFRASHRFQSKSKRIRITNIMVRETKEDRDKTVEAINRDRLYLIDAVLVRIMKARKTITHQQLLVQVMEQVKVPAQMSDVKKRIESLIEREYLERDKKDRSRYNYLA